jgi:tetratricopeptide (TPR) repeat protein
MKEYLDQAEILLRDVVRSRNVSTLVVLHRLRDLAEVLDNLKLYDECRLTGNCALDLAEALGRRSFEFRQEQAETLALIAGLSVYQPRARTLFIQAISICEEVVENNASHSNKHSLFYLLCRAGHRASDDLYIQWLERAIHLMTKEIPPTMVHPVFRSSMYFNFGIGLRQLKQYSHSVEAFLEAISIRRPLANSNPAEHNFYLAQSLMSMGISLNIIGKYDDAIVAYKEALEICTTMSAQDPLQCNKLMPKILINYGITLGNLSQISEAAAVEMQAISLLRNLARTENEHTDVLCRALNNYGSSCDFLGRHAEAVLALQECILLRRALAAANPERESDLSLALSNIVAPLRALGDMPKQMMQSMK